MNHLALPNYSIYRFRPILWEVAFQDFFSRFSVGRLLFKVFIFPKSEVHNHHSTLNHKAEDHKGNKLDGYEVEVAQGRFLLNIEIKADESSDEKKALQVEVRWRGGIVALLNN